ncbi:hypothetical protein [Burkholderia ubonensis]|uniref:hypothetical protein n=1 Tax=Burkholderia ubonensis TaxID=101571 RepID=UPI000A9CF1FF|nr:hypothetical protein [Burkholderia ubonensis]
MAAYRSIFHAQIALLCGLIYDHAFLMGNYKHNALVFYGSAEIAAQINFVNNADAGVVFLVGVLIRPYLALIRRNMMSFD